MVLVAVLVVAVGMCASGDKAAEKLRKQTITSIIQGRFESVIFDNFRFPQTAAVINIPFSYY